jgi:alpha-tubulin suppressor-like RCC1 family protein
LKLRFGTPRRRLALCGGVALVVVGVAAIALRSRSNLPPPIMVSLTQSNGPVRVFSGSDGVVLILPDSSLWRWGRAGAGIRSRVAVPEQLGTKYNWAQAAAGFRHWVGLRQDGSLWEWGYRSWNADPTAGFSTEPTRVDLSHDWIGIAAGITHSVALRQDGTLWAWGDNAMGQLGNGPGPTQTTPVQVGTDADWAAVCCAQSSTLAVRRDGTLWTWGWVLVGGTGSMSVRNLFSQTRVCLESNWTGFISGGFLPLVRNRAGEIWEPFHAAPNAKASAAANCRLVASNSVPGRFAIAYCGEARICELRADGTLWQRAQPLGYSSSATAGQWRRLGKRSDWAGLWGAHGTALGLTADGMLWTWGIDLGREPAADSLSRLKLARSWLTSLIGPRPRPTFAGVMPAYQRQPRPLMRLVLTNSVPPARPRDAGS